MTTEVTIAKQNYILDGMTDEEIDELLDQIIYSAADEVERAESWSMGVWAQRKETFQDYLTEATAAKEAIEAFQKQRAADRKVIADIMTRYADEFLSVVVADITKAGYEFTDFATHVGTKKESSRISIGWQLAFEGRVSVPAKKWEPFRVDSEPGKDGNRKYQVYCRETKLAQHYGNQCECADASYNRNGKKDLQGRCKHYFSARFTELAHLKMAELAAVKQEETVAA